MVNQKSIPSAHAGVLLTTGDVAKLLKRTSEGVRWMARKGLLASETTPSGQRFFHKGDVLRLLAQRDARGKAPVAPVVLEPLDQDAKPQPGRRRRGGDRQILFDHLQRAYNISLAEYDRAVERQGGGCAVCGDSPKAGGRLSVDHDHETGDVRGLLCTSCNAALGFMRERPDLIYRLAAYAEHAALLRERTRRIRAVKRKLSPAPWLDHLLPEVPPV